MGILEELRWTAAQLVNVGKFSVDSAINDSFKGGMQVDATVKQKLKNLPLSPKSDGSKKQGYIAIEEMQATLEKNIKHSDGIKKQNCVTVEENKLATLENMQDDKINVKQKNKIIHRTKPLDDAKELSDQPVKNSIPEVTGRKKIFIRSRL